MKCPKLFVVSSLLIFCSALHAEETWSLNLHTFSHHFSERAHGKTWNGTNPGLGLRRDFGNDFSIQAGFYKNSLSKWSTYAIAEYSPLSVGSFDAGLFAGIRTHYKKPVEFAGGALVRWRVTEHIEITGRLSPKTCSYCSGFVSAELGWKF